MQVPGSVQHHTGDEQAPLLRESNSAAGRTLQVTAHRRSWSGRETSPVSTARRTQGHASRPRQEKMEWPTWGLERDVIKCAGLVDGRLLLAVLFPRAALQGYKRGEELGSRLFLATNVVCLPPMCHAPQQLRVQVLGSVQLHILYVRKALMMNSGRTWRGASLLRLV
ncbi:hypothetical protein NDU88_006752 [Pleurodeles waltl]|uniref:Uncharacterized protein n=1 Tax=Pleurodeles waltl TaxID=8319 RepID=A0AAV7ULX5_PLEWA|nr:hypothetical protein NDU88_006752 [Pleurodeles waltl]